MTCLLLFDKSNPYKKGGLFEVYFAQMVTTYSRELI